MSCQEFESVSMELARGSLLDAAARESAHAHAASCSPCAARLRRERALTSALREVGASMREREAPARVEAALLATLRERRGSGALDVQGVGIGGAQNQARRDDAVSLFAPRFRRALYAAAVAASLLVVAAVAWRALTRKETRGPRSETARVKQIGGDSAPQTTNQPKPQDAQAMNDEAAKDRATTDRANEEVATIRRVGARGANIVRSSASLRASAPVEVLPISFREDGGRVTAGDAPAGSSVSGVGVAELAAAADFVPLGASGNSAPLEDGQMVRVEVPRAALAALGLPVNASRTGATVKADVLLAHDGTARAIRLLP
jgi:hypothetical protein